MAMRRISLYLKLMILLFVDKQAAHIYFLFSYVYASFE